MNKDTLQSNTDWREEFDDLMTSMDRYGGFYHGHKDGVELYNFDNIKSFISQLLEAEKKRWRDAEKNPLVGRKVLIKIDTHKCSGWNDNDAMLEDTAYGTVTKVIKLS